MSTPELSHAKNLIEQKRYEEARSLLKTIDHPTAKEWLATLDEAAIAKSSGRVARSRPAPSHTRRGVSFLSAMSVIAIVALTIIVVYQHMRINNLVRTVGVTETNLALFYRPSSGIANANTLISRLEMIEVDVSDLGDGVDLQGSDLQSLSSVVNSHLADLLSLSSVVNSHASDISSLGRTIDSHAFAFSDLRRVVNSHASDITSLSWDLSSVSRVANNANRYAHSHGYSDAALKSDITPIANPLERLLSVRGVSYTWNDEAYPELHLETGRDYGVLAQELARIFPELVTPDSESGFLRVDYEGLIPVLIEAIREQQSQIDELQAAITQPD